MLCEGDHALCIEGNILVRSIGNGIARQNCRAYAESVRAGLTEGDNVALVDAAYGNSLNMGEGGEDGTHIAGTELV